MTHAYASGSSRSGESADLSALLYELSSLGGAFDVEEPAAPAHRPAPQQPVEKPKKKKGLFGR